MNQDVEMTWNIVKTKITEVTEMHVPTALYFQVG